MGVRIRVVFSLIILSSILRHSFIFGFNNMFSIGFSVERENENVGII